MKNILNWYASGEKGISSEAMAAIACGNKPRDRFSNHPHDPADLNRCIKLVDTAPEVKDSFPEIAALSPEWSAVIANWDDLRKSFIEEVGYDWSTSKKAPLTYNKMQALFYPLRKSQSTDA